MIQLLAVDLDGTLLNSQKQVSDRTAAAIAAARERGVRVVIASARPPRSVKPIYDKLQLDTWQINYNGALIYDPAAERPIFHRPIPGELAARVIALSRKASGDVLVSAEVMDRWLTDRDVHTYTTETGRLFRPDGVMPCEQMCASPITKLMLLGDASTLASIAEALSRSFERELAVLYGEPNLIQIMDRRCGKSRALMKIAKHYKLRPENVMAIGDALNDVGMLQFAGVGVAMDNASPAVKDVAQWIAPSNDDHGVSAAIERFILHDAGAAC